MKYCIIDISPREAPAEIEPSYIQNPMMRKGNHTVQDAVVSSQGLWNSLEQIGSIEFRGVNSHLASLGHYHTCMCPKSAIKVSYIL